MSSDDGLTAQQRWYRNNPEKVKEYARLRTARKTEADYEKDRERDRARYAASAVRREQKRLSNQRLKEQDPVAYERRQANDRLKHRYGKTIEEFEATLAAQGGTCALCPKTCEPSGRRLSWDHDHSCCPGKRSCGKCLRAILCSSCNSFIGKIEGGDYNPYFDYIKGWKRTD